MEDWGPPFRFELMWLSEKELKGSVKNRWSSISIPGWMGYQLARKLKFLKRKMLDYKKEVFGNLSERKNQLLEGIQNIDAKEEVGNLDYPADQIMYNWKEIALLDYGCQSDF